MGYNFEEVLNKAKRVQEEAEHGATGSYYIEPCIGSTTVRLLFNPKSGEVLRKVMRHWDPVQNKYIPCLRMYGETCPLCELAREAEEKGKGDWKLNAQTKGMAYVQVINMDEFPEKGLGKGDIGLFKFPKTVYDGINNVIIQAGDNLANLVAGPETFPIVVKRAGKGTETKYSVNSDPFSKVVTAKSEEEMKKILEGLDNLNEVDFPSEINDEIRKQVDESVKARRIEYKLDEAGSVSEPPRP